MSWMTVKVVKTRGAEEFGFCAVLELVAESRGPHAAREAMVAAELAPSKVSADLRDRRGLQVRRDCGFTTAEICVQRCFIATSLKDMRASSYGAESKKLIA